MKTRLKSVPHEHIERAPAFHRAHAESVRVRARRRRGLAAARHRARLGSSIAVFGSNVRPAEID